MTAVKELLTVTGTVTIVLHPVTPSAIFTVYVMEEVGVQVVVLQELHIKKVDGDQVHE